jgi:hypothetical protein
MALRFRPGWGRGVLVLLPALLVLLVAAGALARQTPDARDAAAALPHLAGEPRRFYVTSSNYHGDEALAACATGYHMASLWELLNPGTLSYAREVGGAKLHADQGTGPVAGWWGWVRTGYDSYYLNTAGRANCRAWTSATSGEYGTVVRLADSWTAGAVAISPWQAQTWSCGGTAPVWCVSDPVYGVYLPVVVNGG